jgi:hypothetical protein
LKDKEGYTFNTGEENMTKHTPGPWQSRHDHDTNTMVIESLEAGTPWHELAVVRSTIGQRVDPANARLIAAAPDLLAALGELVAEADEHPGWEGHDPDTFGFDLARAAIARAEGDETS